MALFRQIARGKGSAVICATHDRLMIKRVGDIGGDAGNTRGRQARQ
jgi:hypothetical protein